MTAQILSGTALAQTVKEELKRKLSGYKAGGKRMPGLATVLVGEDPASAVYVRNKIKACEAVGIQSFHLSLSATVSEAQLLERIAEQNAHEDVDGILVQLPLPKTIAVDRVLTQIDPRKDVDGFHPLNMGHLLAGEPSLLPCTPFGIVKLLESIALDWRGKEAVVIGRSTIVGKPISLLLLQRNMTVRMCHSHTRNLEGHLAQADVVVAAIGRGEFIRGEWIKPGAVVIDVGVNRLVDGKLVGDVHFESAVKKASFITPVPGGVGPMTIAMLLYNTVQAYESLITSGAGAS